jgi:hypothetical protein
MSEKKVWISAIDASEPQIRHLAERLKTYGVRAEGHTWVDDPDRYAWKAPLAPLASPAVSAWAVVGSAERLSAPQTRYGLSLLAVGLQSRRGPGFPIAVLILPGTDPAAWQPTTPLSGAAVLPFEGPGVEAKLVARLHAAPKPAAAEYHLDVHVHEQAGQWFEISPAAGVWPGVIAGTAGAGIDMHAVGARGELPRKSVLDHPLKGIELRLGEMAFQAWAAKNTLSPADSYFIRVNGRPKALVFGPYPESEEPELYVVRLG